MDILLITSDGYCSRSLGAAKRGGCSESSELFNSTGGRNVENNNLAGSAGDHGRTSMQ